MTATPSPHRVRARRFAPAAMALTALMLSGCSDPAGADAGGDRDPITIGPVSTITGAEQLSFPLDAYELPPQQARQLEVAVDQLVVDCMTAQGFRWAAPARPALPTGNRHARRYGILDEAEARKTGYHGAPQTGQGAKGREEGQDSSQAAQDAAGPCVLKARAQLDGKESMKKDATGTGAFVEQLIMQDAERAEQDPQVRAAFAKWSDCMSKAGHDYDDPWESNNDPEWGKSETATESERRVAAADAGCKVSTNLPGIWLAVETAYQQRTLETNAQALDQEKKADADRLRRAADVLAKS